MFLRALELEEFRSYRRLQLDLTELGLRLIGANGSGKSSLLEAVAMLATTRSPRSTAEREVVNWGSGTSFGVPPFARLGVEVERAAGVTAIEIGLQLDAARPGIVRKQIRLNGRAVRAADAVGTLKAVLFSPEDVALVAGPPSGRRRYLDLTISQTDGAYLRALSRYLRVLAQRNSLLKSLARARASANDPGAAAQLAYWDGELVALGAAVIARRSATIHRLAVLARERFEHLTGDPDFDLGYRTGIAPESLPPPDTALPAAQAVVAREYESRLAAARPEELRRGVSLVGPHRDDLSFAVDGVDLATYGSRGQQRLAVIAVKLAETVLMTEVAGEPPILLLDDVLSELDAAHRALVTRTASAAGAQVIVTATDRDSLAGDELAALPTATVEAGEITMIETPSGPGGR